MKEKTEKCPFNLTLMTWWHHQTIKWQNKKRKEVEKRGLDVGIRAQWDMHTNPDVLDDLICGPLLLYYFLYVFGPPLVSSLKFSWSPPNFNNSFITSRVALPNVGLQCNCPDGAYIPSNAWSKEIQSLDVARIVIQRWILNISSIKVRIHVIHP